MPAASAEEELHLIMTCLKHTENRGKPNFDAVAKELGIKASACYHRHWNLLKKHGMTGTRARNAGKPAMGKGKLTTPAVKGKVSSAPKRGRKKDTTPLFEIDGDLDEDDDDIDTPTKKVKTEADHDEKKTADEAGGEGDWDTIEIEDDEAQEE